jgi:flagellar biosynthesis protein FliQ
MVTSSDVINNLIYLVIIISTPISIGCLLVGIIISIIQTITQIQETTLTFIPKLIITILICFLLHSFITDKMYIFTNSIFDRIIHL